MSLLSIVIPTWNNADLTVSCLSSVFAHTRNDVQIIWIDNGSDDANHAQVKHALSGVSHVLERHANPLGFARAVNRGLVLVEGDYCAILNNDTDVTEGWDIELIDAVDDTPGLAGPLCLSPIGWQNCRSHPWLEIPETIESDREISRWLRENWAGTVIDLPEAPTLDGFRNMLAFFCVLMPRTVLETVGLLDENFGWGYYEDDDYCWRARRHGFGITLCPGAVVLHKAGQTMGKLNEDWNAILRRNHRYLAEKTRRWSLPETEP